MDVEDCVCSLLQKRVILSGDRDFVAAGVLAAAADFISSTQGDFDGNGLRKAHKLKRSSFQALCVAQTRNLVRHC